MKASHSHIPPRRPPPLSGALFGLALLLAGCGGGGGSSTTAADDPAADAASLTLAELGQRIFEDENLSNPVGQSCASCHVAAEGFADPRSLSAATAVSVGADGSFGSRNAPTASYAAHIPEFTVGPPVKGGQFVDGRDNTLENQARRPFLNPLEMNNANEAAVIAKLRVASYAGSFLNLFGATAFDDVNVAYTQMVTAIAAFERTPAFSPFSSKFDAFFLNGTPLADDEERGRILFFGAAGCSRCHSTSPADGPQVFSDFRYTNIGVPANPANPFLAVPGNAGFIDLGLGAAQAMNDNAHDGKFRTPTLRNVAKTAPYMHNGVFDTLQEVMAFYNVRAEIAEVANAIENPGNTNPGDIGNLGLNAGQIDDLIAFMEALSDT